MHRRSSEFDIIRGEERSLHTATGFVVDGMLPGLFWGLLGCTAWRVI
jgi:hypothetical protein